MEKKADNYNFKKSDNMKKPKKCNTSNTKYVHEVILGMQKNNEESVSKKKITDKQLEDTFYKLFGETRDTLDTNNTTKTKDCDSSLKTKKIEKRRNSESLHIHKIEKISKRRSSEIPNMPKISKVENEKEKGRKKTILEINEQLKEIKNLNVKPTKDCKVLLSKMKNCNKKVNDSCPNKLTTSEKPLGDGKSKPSLPISLKINACQIIQKRKSTSSLDAPIKKKRVLNFQFAFEGHVIEKQTTAITKIPKNVVANAHISYEIRHYAKTMCPPITQNDSFTVQQHDIKYEVDDDSGRLIIDEDAGIQQDNSVPKVIEIIDLTGSCTVIKTEIVDIQTKSLCENADKVISNSVEKQTSSLPSMPDLENLVDNMPQIAYDQSKVQLDLNHVNVESVHSTPSNIKLFQTEQSATPQGSVINQKSTIFENSHRNVAELSTNLTQNRSSILQLHKNEKITSPSGTLTCNNTKTTIEPRKSCKTLSANNKIAAATSSKAQKDPNHSEGETIVNNSLLISALLDKRSNIETTSVATTTLPLISNSSAQKNTSNNASVSNRNLVPINPTILPSSRFQVANLESSPNTRTVCPNVTTPSLTFSSMSRISHLSIQSTSSPSSDKVITPDKVTQPQPSSLHQLTKHLENINPTPLTNSYFNPPSRSERTQRNTNKISQYISQQAVSTVAKTRSLTSNQNKKQINTVPKSIQSQQAPPPPPPPYELRNSSNFPAPSQSGSVQYKKITDEQCALKIYPVLLRYWGFRLCGQQFCNKYMEMCYEDGEKDMILFNHHMLNTIFVKHSLELLEDLSLHEVVPFNLLEIAKYVTRKFQQRIQSFNELHFYIGLRNLTFPGRELFKTPFLLKLYSTMDYCHMALINATTYFKETVITRQQLDILRTQIQQYHQIARRTNKMVFPPFLPTQQATTALNTNTVNLVNSSISSYNSTIIDSQVLQQTDRIEQAKTNSTNISYRLQTQNLSPKPTRIQAPLNTNTVNQVNSSISSYNSTIIDSQVLQQTDRIEQAKTNSTGISNRLQTQNLSPKQTRIQAPLNTNTVNPMNSLISLYNSTVIDSQVLQQTDRIEQAKTNSTSITNRLQTQNLSPKQTRIQAPLYNLTNLATLQNNPEYLQSKESKTVKDRNVNLEEYIPIQIGMKPTIVPDNPPKKNFVPTVQLQDENNSDEEPKETVKHDPEQVDSEIIDLTWLEDFDQNYIKNEIEQYAVKEEEFYQEAASPVDSGLGSPPASCGYDNLQVCLCGKNAQFICACKTSTYCSSDCQALDWENHKDACIKIWVVSSPSLE